MDLSPFVGEEEEEIERTLLSLSETETQKMAAAKAVVVLPRPVTFVTGNAKKLEEVKAIIGNSIPFKSLKLDRAYSFQFLSFEITVFSPYLESHCLNCVFLELQCLSFKVSLRISPKRRLV